MSEKQLFTVLVRALGVLVILDGFRQAWFCFARLLWRPELPYLYSYEQNLVYTVAVFAFGAMIIRAPQIFVRFAWRDHEVSN